MCGRFAMNDELNELVTEYVLAGGVTMLGYYEWVEVVEAGKKVRQPHLMRPYEGDLLHAAGLCTLRKDPGTGEWASTFTILKLAASSDAIAATIVTYEVGREGNNGRTTDRSDPSLIEPLSAA